MRPQMLDESVSFSCGSCTFCCDQPWRTLIEVEKADALEQHDFSAYPQLTGKAFYDKSAKTPKGFYELAKGHGTRCLFLDTDGLCIIHKELGPEAKPRMCRQFPYLLSRACAEDRVSVNFGCPVVQCQSGPSLSEQAEQIATVVRKTPRPPDPDALVPLDASIKLTQPEADALFQRLVSLFDTARSDDVWSCFAEALALLVVVRAHQGQANSEGANPASLVDLLGSGEVLPDTPEVPEIRGYPHPAKAPMPARTLFVATLFPDALPPDAGEGVGLVRRLALIPKLLSLMKLSGGYPSRLLGRNVSIDDVLQHEVEEEMDPEGARLLIRYYRSRLWQRLPAGTKLPIIAGIHQHIHDLNAIIFLARAEAQAQGQARLTDSLIRRAVTRVEFHLANQPRLYDHTLKALLRSQLGNPAIALQSLRLMSLRRAPQVVTSADAEDGP
jgi:Fe-S-cluster containining protein